MSYGSESATAASNAGSAASNAGTAASTVEGASTAATAYDAMGNVAGNTGASGTPYMNAIGDTGQQGFTLGSPTEAGQNYLYGADTTAYGNQVSNAVADKANLETYGTTDPSIWQKGGNLLVRFSKGKDHNMVEAWKNFGNNPETYGYVFGKMEGMMKGGGGGTQAPPVTLNNTYQQPENEYLRRYMMARRR